MSLFVEHLSSNKNQLTKNININLWFVNIFGVSQKNTLIFSSTIPHLWLENLTSFDWIESSEPRLQSSFIYPETLDKLIFAPLGVSVLIFLCNLSIWSFSNDLFRLRMRSDQTKSLLSYWWIPWSLFLDCLSISIFLDSFCYLGEMFWHNLITCEDAYSKTSWVIRGYECQSAVCI